MVAAHAAIALSFQECQSDDRDSIFKALQSRIALMKQPGKLNRADQAEEAAATLATIEQNLSKELWQMELLLSRQLNSATASEAVDLVAAPVSTEFDVLSYVRPEWENAARGLRRKQCLRSPPPD